MSFLFAVLKILYVCIIGSQASKSIILVLFPTGKSMKTDILMHSITLMYSWEMKPGKLIDNAVLYALCGSCITKGAVGVYK